MNCGGASLKCSEVIAIAVDIDADVIFYKNYGRHLTRPLFCTLVTKFSMIRLLSGVLV